MESSKTSNLLKKSKAPVDIVKELAMLCQIHDISIVDLQENIDANTKLDTWEAMIIEQISKQLVTGDVFVEIEDSLVYNEDGEMDETPETIEDIEDSDCEEIDIEGGGDDKDDFDYHPIPEKKSRVYSDEIPRERWEKAYRFWTKQNDLSVPPIISTEYIDNIGRNKTPAEVVNRRYKHFVDKNCLSLRRWVKKIENGIITVCEINKIVLQKFNEKRAKNGIVTDRTLRMWARQAKLEYYPLMKFKASMSWLLNFKRKYNIVSRSITHKVGKNYVKDHETLKQKRDKFLENFRQKMEEKLYQPNKIFNVDQSRFDKELHSHRTLERKGLKRVDATVGSVSATKHSYMIDPAVNMAGQLLPPLYILSQEVGGKFPKNMPPFPPNIHAYAGTSAIMKKQDLEIFLRKVLFPAIRDTGVSRCLLLVDSWSSNRDQILYDQIGTDFPELQVEKLLIPEGTTGTTQPLDVFFFRPYKRFVRQVTDSLEIGDKSGRGISTFGCKHLPIFSFKLPDLKT